MPALSKHSALKFHTFPSEMTSLSFFLFYLFSYSPLFFRENTFKANISRIQWSEKHFNLFHVIEEENKKLLVPFAGRNPITEVRPNPWQVKQSDRLVVSLRLTPPALRAFAKRFQQLICVFVTRFPYHVEYVTRVYSLKMSNR